MAGFLVTNISVGVDVECEMKAPLTCIRKKEIIGNYTVKQSIGHKFSGDCLCGSIGDDYYILEGVILNKSKLMEIYSASDFLSTVGKMHEKKPQYYNDFRGGFSGAYYNAKDDVWEFFTNHFGEHNIFYWMEDESFIVSSDFNWLIDTLKAAGKTYTFNLEAFKSILSMGWVYKDHTMVSEVKRVLGGHAVRIHGKEAQVIQYHKFNNYKFNRHSEKEIIENVDKLFRNAIDMEYKKDLEYGYNHIAGLSGGLDSRMDVWVANEMGYKDITVLTFGQSGEEDIDISCQIASKLNLPHIIKTLDDAAFVKDIPRIVHATYGLQNVAGTIHWNSLFKLLNAESFGVVHSGQVGDAILASNWKTHIFPNSLVGADGSIGAFVQYDRSYKNEELYFMYERVSHYARGGEKHNFEDAPYVSPFVDVDFAEYCFSIPLKYRYNHYIYFKWIEQRYPGAAEFIWEHTGCKVNATKEQIARHNKICEIKRVMTGKRKEKLGMNPFDYWYKQNKEMRSTINHLFCSNINTPYLDNAVKHMVKDLFKRGGCINKIQIISALQAIEQYFG